MCAGDITHNSFVCSDVLGAVCCYLSSKDKTRIPARKRKLLNDIQIERGHEVYKSHVLAS